MNLIYKIVCPECGRVIPLYCDSEAFAAACRCGYKYADWDDGLPDFCNDWSEVSPKFQETIRKIVKQDVDRFYSAQWVWYGWEARQILKISPEEYRALIADGSLRVIRRPPVRFDSSARIPLRPSELSACWRGCCHRQAAIATASAPARLRFSAMA